MPPMHDPAYVEEAIARARAKLAALRAGAVDTRAAGLFRWRLGVGVALLALGCCCVVLAVEAISVAAARTGGDSLGAAVVAVISVTIAILCLLSGLHRVLASRARSPEDAVVLFFRAAMGRMPSGARRLVAPNDFDGMPRGYPEEDALGRGGVPPYRFGEADDFEEYWKGLVRYHPVPYCLSRFRNLRAEEIAPDLATVEFDLTVRLNTSLWLLFLFLAKIHPSVGPLLWAFVEHQTRKRVTVHLRKVLYRVEDEWHLLNGEWQGPEEKDVSWLGA